MLWCVEVGGEIEFFLLICVCFGVEDEIDE